jgi:hypothetical protein
VDEKCFDKFWPRIRLSRNSRNLLHAANLRHGTEGFTSPPKEGINSYPANVEYRVSS